MAKRETGAFGPVVRWIDREGGAGADSPPAWAVDLVESVEPFRVPIGLKQRMLLTLGSGRARPSQRWLRPLVVCAVLLSGTAVASAAFTGWPANLVRVCRALVGGPEPTRGAVRPVDARAPRSGPSAARAAATEAGPDGALADEATLIGHPIADSRRRARLRVLPAEDPALVVDATRALRVDRDARRARLLAARYLQQHPRGALAQEALAIQVEAALDHHDADAASAAARYLSLYPHGAFRAVAQRALSAR
jgi:hypothetical protein